MCAFPSRGRHKFPVCFVSTGVDGYNEIRGAPRDMAWLCPWQSLELQLENAEALQSLLVT